MQAGTNRTGAGIQTPLQLRTRSGRRLWGLGEEVPVAALVSPASSDHGSNQTQLAAGY